MDPQQSLDRLVQVHGQLLLYAQNESLREELFLLDELDLFNPDAFSQYMTNASFKKKVMKQVKSLQKTQADLLEKGLVKTVKDRATAQARTVALAGVEQLTGLNIAKAQLVTQEVNSLVSRFTASTSQKTVAAAIKEMGTDFVTGSLQSLGKGFVAGVIMTASLEALSYATGYDLTVFDPFNEIFGATELGDGTISGNLNTRISKTLYPEFHSSLDMGFYTNPENFSARMIQMALVAESRAKGQTIFGFLGE